MKVIFANRKEMYAQKGGDTVQFLQTKKYLELNHGVEIVECFNPSEIELHANADLIHIFNIQTIDQTAAFVFEANRFSIPIALSPIYWDLTASSFVIRWFLLFGSNKFIKHFFPFKNIFNLIFSFLLSFVKKKSIIDVHSVSKVLREVDVMLPNSIEEVEHIAKSFNVPFDELIVKTLAVPNAFELPQVPLPEKKENIVLMAARIEILKNQMGVVQALMDRPDIPIYFIGRVADEKYNAKLIKLANLRGNVQFYHEMPQDELFKFYLRAKVHVLPSFRESPGLSTLEAIAHGASVVVSDGRFCPTNFYDFHKKGFICNPLDCGSIKRAVLAALDEEYTKEQDASYLQNFSYSNAAALTYKAYSSIKKVKL